jgi:hypothetical protein
MERRHCPTGHRGCVEERQVVDLIDYHRSVLNPLLYKNEMFSFEQSELQFKLGIVQDDRGHTTFKPLNKFIDRSSGCLNNFRTRWVERN